MIKRLLFGLLMFVFCTCAFAERAAAQTIDPCLTLTDWSFPQSIPSGWFYYAPYPGTYTYVIAAMLAICAPVAAPVEICLPCLAAAAGRPINLATGNTYIRQVDVRIPGLSDGLTLVRTWNSRWPSTQSGYQIGLFGPNWSSTYDQRVFVGSDKYIKWEGSDGNFSSFGSTGVGTTAWVLAAPQGSSTALVTPNTASPYWLITLPNGEQRKFDSTSGMLTAIIDRNGNTTTLTYDSANRLATVTDPASRHLYFGYGSPSSHLVTSVTSDVGISLTYAYDTQGRLSVVTNPDLSTLTYTYNSQSLITSVTDSNGKVLESHTYDSGAHGLTSSRAAGVEAVTITYP